VTKAGRPVLVGTRSVAASEEVSARLTTAGLSQHTVLNARQDRAEADRALPLRPTWRGAGRIFGLGLRLCKPAASTSF